MSTQPLMRLSRAEIVNARHLQTTIFAAGIEARPNPTGVSARDRYLFGYLGETAVVCWLVIHDVTHEWRPSPDGRSQGADIVVDGMQGHEKIEVKTASKPHYRKMLCQKVQPIDANVYVGCRIERLDDTCDVRLMGWLPAEDVRALPIETIQTPVRSALFTDLKPMDWLLKRFDERY